MFLKKVEICGFKSFSKKIELNFSKGISAIVGPNGSGKSNISDAIRWVIGEQSVKALRGSRMEDVIFAGSDKMKPANFAEVTLLLDNQDRYIDLDYNEISITRRMYRSGESEYYINRSQCRLRDIVEMLMDTGIGKDGYSIIGQGKIDEILSSKSDDRRVIFEEAAGITKYKYRKLNSEKKLKKTEENIIRIQDIIHEVKNQLVPLSKQAETAKKYGKLLHELKTLEVNLIVVGIDKSKEKLKRITEDIKALQESYKQRKLYIKEIEEKQYHSREKLNALDSQLNQLNEGLYNLINNKEKTKGDIRLYNEKMMLIQENLNKLITENDSFIEEKQYLSIKTEDDKNMLQVIEDELFSVIDSRKSMDIEYEKKYFSISEMENKVEELKQLQINYINKLSDVKNKSSNLNIIVGNINNRLGQLYTENKLHEEKHKEKLLLKENIFMDSKKLKAKMESKKARIEELKKNREILEQKIKNTEDLLIKVRSEKDNVSSRLKLLQEIERDYGGYNKTIKAILSQQKSIKNRISGFRGVLGEIVSVPEKWAVAIEIALGFAMQNIITDTEDDAKQLIEFLKRNNIGRATFLPISSIKPRSFTNYELSKIKGTGFEGIAAEMVVYAKEYKNIIHYLLGRIAVMDNIDSAIRLARDLNYGIKIVTLDGEVINVGGAITGGSKAYSSGTILTRKNQISALKSRYEKLMLEEEKQEKALNLEKSQYFDLGNGINTSIEILHGFEVELNNLNNSMATIGTELELLENKMIINNKQIEELGDEEKETAATIEEDDGVILKIEEEKRHIEFGINELQEKIKAQKNKRDCFMQELTDLKIREAELKQKKSALIEKTDNQFRAYELLHKKIENGAKSIEEAKEEIRKVKLYKEDMETEIENISSKIADAEKVLESTKESKIELQNNIEDTEKIIKEKQMDLYTLQDSLHKFDLQETKCEMEIENLEFKLLDTYEMSYRQAYTLRLDEFNVNESNRRCQALKEEIKGLGIINANAVEEHEKLNNRYIFLNEQLEDLIKSKELLNKVIDDIVNYMEKQFLSELSKINENFNIIFKSLFGGGTAKIVLADKEDVLESDIEIIAKPPNKKLQNLMLMSGGEKALTAIALLFAILQMKPAPFCILDEIDSALDDANVVRYAKYLEDFAKDSQFIIITHRKGSMESADCLYGVSMEDTGTSKLLSVRLEDKVS